MSRIPTLRKLPLIVAGLFVASSAFSAALQSEVKDSQGQPLGNTQVWVLSSTGTVIATAKTDGNGIAQFPDVANGHYVVEIKGTDFAAIRKEVDVAGTGRATVSLAMNNTAPTGSGAAPAANAIIASSGVGGSNVASSDSPITSIEVTA
ncbi:MAG TPA: carboxypeptidase-like regulatory domain-containing protein, partial [Burkholderiaceae bacterium]|nr:carboxypeptidase-like regulatory domain-containing protein [Burkholderiaceae bacterium]